MNPPWIGITTSYEEGEQRLAIAYVDAVVHAGGVPLILPMHTSEDGLRQTAEMLQGLVVIGGPAITTGLIGDLPPDIALTDPRRTWSDEQYLQIALDHGIPVLGICYGMQLLNALDGGTIYADVQAQVAGTQCHSASRGGTTHPVHIRPGTHLHEILNRDVVEVNTRHVQAIATPGTHMVVSGTAPDGVIEAIESPDGRAIGLQFHPERMGDEMLPLFKYLVHEATRH